MTAPKIPQYHELMWPALQATKKLGGSATVSEMNERAMAAAGISEDSTRQGLSLNPPSGFE